MYVAQERRAYILRLLQQRGSIRSASLARELGVTDETIRTDLVDLQAQGLLQRVHGGARYTLPWAEKTLLPARIASWRGWLSATSRMTPVSIWTMTRSRWCLFRSCTE